MAQRPLLVTVRDESEQARYVAERVLENREAGIALKSQAVLFRASHHAAMLEIELTRRNIPFVKFGGLKFLDAAHVKDMLACLRLAENPRDRVAGFRVAAAPAGRRAGDRGARARSRSRPPTVARRSREFAPPPRAADEWRAFAELFGQLFRRVARLAGRARRGARVVRAASRAHPRRRLDPRRRSRPARGRSPPAIRRASASSPS